MSQEPVFLNLKTAASVCGLTPRYLRRAWPKLLADGVKVSRLPTPKDPQKGQLLFERRSLIFWIEQHAIKMPVNAG
ncbi:MAG: hypothetical protein A2Z83_06350 [Omnitrophica bacterium GWA2_52_8]|nr:MAG: hypothetical protein A2Z83_06350 [Omnitrophica bacterium GWA2_52_8]